MSFIQRIFGFKITRLALGAIVLVLIVRSAMILLPDCALLPNFFSPWFATAVLLAVIYRIVNAYGWTLVLQAMHQDVNGLQATRIWLHAESRRWLPGGVWGYASRAIQAERIGVSAKVASASMLVELLVIMVAAVVLFIPVLLLYRAEFINAVGSLAEYERLFWILTATVAIAGCTCFMVRNKLTTKLHSIKQRFVLLGDLDLDYHKLSAALGFYVLMGILNGAVTCCLIWSMDLGQFPPLFVVIAATSFAWVVGFLAVFAPGGMVVREATFATCLGLWMPYSTALAIAILARVVQLAAEVAGMLWVWAYGLEWRMSKQPASTPDPMVRL